jgi:hypothetical protein
MYKAQFSLQVSTALYVLYLSLFLLSVNLLEGTRLQATLVSDCILDMSNLLSVYHCGADGIAV